MAQGKSPRNPLAFASALYPRRCLASQPTGSGGEFAVVLRNRPSRVAEILATSAAFACSCASEPSSSLPSPRGVPGHSARPRHSRHLCVLRAPQRASGASSGKREMASAPPRPASWGGGGGGGG